MEEGSRLRSRSGTAVELVDVKKAFDSVPHDTLVMKLERDFGISGPLLDWIKSYLKNRQQFTIANGVKSGMLPVSFGIPQGSVLGPTLFALFTNDLPTSVKTGSVYMFADDTSIYCTGVTAEKAIAQLNTALQEIYEWCLFNRLTRHPGKSEAVLITRSPPDDIPLIFIGSSVIKWVSKSRLLGMTVDGKRTWLTHLL